MESIFAGPGKYIQGRGLIYRLGDYLKEYGRKCLILADDLVLHIIGDPLESSLAKSGIMPSLQVFSGECCRSEIARLSAVAKDFGSEIVLAAGGGKALDAGKAVAFEQGAVAVVFPTIASTDAPTSSISVLYSEDHVYEGVLRFPQNPSLIVVDTEIIAKAPPRFLVAGMGDALATKFEARACFYSGAKNARGGKCTLAGLALADLAYEIILNHGISAKWAAEKGLVTPSLEKVIEANILLSGLGWENGGLAVPHALHGALTEITRVHSAFHGEKVAFGILVQMVLEDKNIGEIEELLQFYLCVGLPTQFSSLGLEDPTEEEITKIVTKMCQKGSYVYNMPFAVTKEMIRDAMILADKIGTEYPLRCRKLTG